MEYKGILPERKTWVKIAAVILVGYMLYREILIGQWIYIPLAVLILLACFYKKEHIISEEGVDIRGNVLSVPLHNWWKWDEITTIHADYKKASPNVMLHIGKDVVTRSFVMKPADIPAVVELAARKNPEIYIENLSEEERQRRDAEILHRQEVARAQKAAKKRKK